MNEIITVLKDYTDITIVVSAGLFGYLLKNYIPLDNRHIPLVLATFGVTVSFALNGFVSFEATILTGALSGLASTGIHQLIKQYITGKEEE